MDKDEALLLSKAEDTLRLAQKRYGVKALGFLNPKERVFLQRQLLAPPDMTLFFDGGYEEAERTLMVCHPDFLAPDKEDYLAMLSIEGRDIKSLSHRDYLGSLMGLGITRESIGDILPGSDRAYLFVKPEQTNYILQNLTKIGRCGISLTLCPPNEAKIAPKAMKEISTTVSSVRLDAVVAAGIGLSRGKCVPLIASGQVSVNFEPCENTARTLKEGDVLSVRGYGRMKLLKIGGLTRKGRCVIEIGRYL